MTAGEEVGTARAATKRVRFSLRARGTRWVVIDCATLRTVYTAGKRKVAAAVAETFNVQDPISAPNTRVDAAPVRQHVRALLATGLSQADVAAAAGVAPALIWHLLSERNPRVTYRIASALRRVDPSETRPSSARVDAKPTWELLDRLDAGGFRVEWVVDVLSLNWTVARPRRIRLEHARAVRALYADIRERVPMVRALERGG
jgi:transcriptional regulator with XRE-family HTH domain